MDVSEIVAEFLLLPRQIRNNARPNRCKTFDCPQLAMVRRIWLRRCRDRGPRFRLNAPWRGASMPRFLSLVATRKQTPSGLATRIQKTLQPSGGLRSGFRFRGIDCGA